MVERRYPEIVELRTEPLFEVGPWIQPHTMSEDRGVSDERAHFPALMVEERVESALRHELGELHGIHELFESNHGLRRLGEGCDQRGRDRPCACPGDTAKPVSRLA